MSKTTTILALPDFDVHIARKNIKRLYLTVNPPHGEVHLSIPQDTSDTTIKECLLDQMEWIKWKRKEMESLDFQFPRQYVTGEDHYLLGARYRLKLIESTTQTPHVHIENNSFLQLYIRPRTTLKGKERIMHNFYRETLRKEIPTLAQKWSFAMDIDPPKEVLIKKMKSRWGTCLPEKRRIWLSLNLAKYPYRFLEYVFVHEMVHFLERGHGKRFQSYMDTFLPSWRRDKKDLAAFAVRFYLQDR